MTAKTLIAEAGLETSRAVATSLNLEAAPHQKEGAVQGQATETPAQQQQQQQQQHSASVPGNQSSQAPFAGAEVQQSDKRHVQCDQFAGMREQPVSMQEAASGPQGPAPAAAQPHLTTSSEPASKLKAGTSQGVSMQGGMPTVPDGPEAAQLSDLPLAAAADPPPSSMTASEQPSAPEACTAEALSHKACAGGQPAVQEDDRDSGEQDDEQIGATGAFEGPLSGQERQALPHLLALLRDRARGRGWKGVLRDQHEAWVSVLPITLWPQRSSCS